MTKPDTLLALVNNGTGRITAGFLISCLRSFTVKPVDLIYVSDGPYVGRARNAAATYFLTQTQYPFLLFIDMDMIFTLEHIDLLYSSNEPIVAGVFYLKLADRLQVAAIKLEGVKYNDDFKGRVEVKRAGTGFMRIHRSVFQKLTGDLSAQPYKDYAGKPQFNFFPQPITDGELLPEDWGFCDLARESGFKVWLDTRIQLLHEGTCVYPQPFNKK